jgi:small subunit ribosomal protein S18
MLSSRKKSCYFKRNNIHEIDYKDTRLLNKFVNDQGKLLQEESLVRVVRCTEN